MTKPIAAAPMALRTVASQMVNSRGKRITVRIGIEDAVFNASGKTIEFPGFRRAYVEGSDDPHAELSDQESEDAQKAAMALLIHVSNCDGLAILSERFTQAELDDLGDKFLAAREKGISLLEWADTIRKSA